MTKKKSSENIEKPSIIPADLLNLMSEFARKYIMRCKLWQNQPRNDEQLIKLNESIKKIEPQIFNYPYHPLKYTLNEQEFSDDEKRLFILLFVLKTERSVFKLCVEKSVIDEMQR